jgi:hypothetical protein
MNVQPGLAGDERFLVLATIAVEAVLEKEDEVLRAFADGQEKVCLLYADYLQRAALTRRAPIRSPRRERSGR